MTCSYAFFVFCFWVTKVNIIHLNETESQSLHWNSAGHLQPSRHHETKCHKVSLKGWLKKNHRISLSYPSNSPPACFARKSCNSIRFPDSCAVLLLPRKQRQIFQRYTVTWSISILDSDIAEPNQMILLNPIQHMNVWFPDFAPVIFGWTIKISTLCKNKSKSKFSPILQLNLETGQTSRNDIIKTLVFKVILDSNSGDTEM